LDFFFKSRLSNWWTLLINLRIVIKNLFITIIDISLRIFSLMYCCCVSMIIVICICPPGALIWLINLFLFLFLLCLSINNKTTFPFVHYYNKLLSTTSILECNSHKIKIHVSGVDLRKCFYSKILNH
jgi:hypothetical protein